MVSVQAYSAEGTKLPGAFSTLSSGKRDLAAEYLAQRSSSEAIEAQVVAANPSLSADFAEYRLADLNQDNSVNIIDVLGIVNIASGASSASDYQLWSADLDANHSVNVIDASTALQKSADVNLEASLTVSPDTLSLATGETGLILAGNAGNAAFTLTVTAPADVTVSKVGGLDGQTAAYEVTPNAGAQSGPVLVSAGVAGEKSVTLFVGEPASLPTITLTSPSENASLLGNSLTVSWATSNTNENDHVHVTLDDDPNDPNDYVGGQPVNGFYTFGNVAAGPHTLTVEVADMAHVLYENPGAADSVNVTLEATPTTGDVLYRVNTGGPELAAADSSSPAWSKDSSKDIGSTNASPYYVAGDANLFDDSKTNAYKGPVDMSHPSLPASVPNALFQTERWDPDSGAEMQWDFPIAANQTVEVRLYFAELFSGVVAAGQRVFDVALDGSVPTVFNDIDPFAVAGAKGAFMLSHTLTVTDGTLDIDFLHDVIENPAVKGIEIVTSDGATTNRPPQLDSLPDRTDAEGTKPDLAIPASDPDGDNLTYSATGLPTGLSVVDPTNGHIGGTIAQGAADNSPYTVTVTVTDGADSVQKMFTWTITPAHSGGGAPSALVEVNPGAGLFASTFDSGSFKIQNTGDVEIESVSFDLSGSFLPDVVFDPTGAAGDSGAKCLTANSGASTVGFVAPSNLCTTPFSQPHNGSNADEGFDVLTVAFNDFGNSETFSFSVDIDPTSIKGDSSTGDAGSISGFELVGSKVTVVFANGVTLTSNLWEEGSLGGSQTVVAPAPPGTPTISVSGVTAPATVTSAAQTITVSGPVNAAVTLLQADARLYIDSGSSGGYDLDPFEANEVLAKKLYTTTLNGSGQASIPVTLLKTASPNAGPSAGMNHFVAVVEGTGNQTSATSNVVVLEYAPDSSGGGGEPASGAFIEENGLVVIEMESAPSLPDSWKVGPALNVTSPNISNPGDATGGKFLVWEGSQALSSPGTGLITYQVKINTPGTYKFQWRNQVGNGTVATEHNDTWLKIEADAFYGQKSGSIVCPKGYTSATNDCTGAAPAGAGANGWFKVYSSGATNWSWSTKASDNDAHDIFARFDQAGVYNILVSARSSSHVIDRMVLYRSGNPTGNVTTGTATATGNPESARTP